MTIPPGKLRPVTDPDIVPNGATFPEAAREYKVTKPFVFAT